MKKIFSWPGLLMLLVITISACTKENQCIRGNSHTTSQTLKPAAFEGIDLRLPAHVQVVKTNEHSVVISASDNHIGLIRAYVEGDNLIIDTDNKCLKNTNINITITTPAVNYLRVAGSGDMILTDPFTAFASELKVDGSGSIRANLSGDNITATISGSGTIQLQGEVKNFNPVISGSGDVKAYSLTAQKVQARISGSGKIQTTATEQLDVTIAGSGDVFYKGHPAAINTNISGSGRLVKAD